MRRTAIVIAPGRGSYGSKNLQSLKAYHSLPQANSIYSFVDFLDQQRLSQKRVSITEMDQSPKFRQDWHLKGENASDLIFAIASCDFLSINRDMFEIIGVCGNSMGHYIACHWAGALGMAQAFRVVNTMGAMMERDIIGQQIIYSLVNEHWHFAPKKQEALHQMMTQAREKGGRVYPSIYLGGMQVIGADQIGGDYLMQHLPRFSDTPDYPLFLPFHAAFHTPLLESILPLAHQELPDHLFHSPSIPLIDGRGYIWYPWSSTPHGLWEYTLNHQVVKPYDFTTCIEIALKELAPDVLILTGPGSSLGGAIAQIIIRERWWGIDSKQSFLQRQKENPVLLSMGIEDQRNIVCPS